MGFRRKLTIGLALVLAGTVLYGDASSPPTPALVLRGALIRTQTEAGDLVGTIVILNGKVVAVGPEANAPSGATVIDASKCVITPGLIDAHSVLGLNSGAANEGGRDANLDILHAVDPFTDDWRDAARQGVTAIYVQPAASGTALISRAWLLSS